MSDATQQHSWLLDLLAIVRLRPGSFLGDEEVRTLRAFVDGYAAARIDMGLPEMSSDEKALLDGFTAWLKHRFGHSTMDWCWIIENRFRQHPRAADVRSTMSATDGSTRLFFDLFEEYLASLNRTLPDGRAILRDENRHRARFWGRPPRSSDQH